jgi:hypothetical protein
MWHRQVLQTDNKGSFADIICQYDQLCGEIDILSKSFVNYRTVLEIKVIDKLSH